VKNRSSSMKKTALAVAICGSLGFSAAHAATVSEFANGVLVPYVSAETITTGNDGGNRTAIGLTSCAAGTVYWTFFGVNSEHLADGTFQVSADDQVNIVWGNQPDNEFDGDPIGGMIRPDLAGDDGYMVFVLDSGGLAGVLDSSDSPCLAGNAFQLDLASNDVAFTPALPLDAAVGDFGPAVGGVYVPNLTGMGPATVAGLNAGANTNDEIYMRYFVDGAAGGDDTTIYVWATDNAGGGPTNTVNIYDNDQTFFSVNLNLGTELSVVNPEDNGDLENRPTEMLDGFIHWTVPAAAGDVVSWSVVSSNALGAAQTIMNPINKLNSAGGPVFRVKVQHAATVPADRLSNEIDPAALNAEVD
jgi:hypothetical protein